MGSSDRLHRGMLACCPVLLYNIANECCPLSPPAIILHPSLFGSRPPAIPMARTLIVARVASPFSVDRAYQPLFLRALRIYFEGMKRIVKKGDMIAIRIDTDVVRRIRDADTAVEDQADLIELDYW
jgi:peroxin-6